MRLREAVRSCLTQYANFQGRASRSEYWFWTFFVALLVTAGFVAMGIADVIVGGNSAGIIFGILAVIAGLGLFLPSLAVAIRRLHDTNSSGWWYLLVLLPYVGGLIMFVWYCIKGTDGENRFGPDPLQPDISEVFS
jgi:uncharacterized membrane protein YhaH (DUF805 family)